MKSSLIGTVPQATASIIITSTENAKKGEGQQPLVHKPIFQVKVTQGHQKNSFSRSSGQYKQTSKLQLSPNVSKNQGFKNNSFLQKPPRLKKPQVALNRDLESEQYVYLFPDPNEENNPQTQDDLFGVQPPPERNEEQKEMIATKDAEGDEESVSLYHYRSQIVLDQVYDFIDKNKNSENYAISSDAVHNQTRQIKNSFNKEGTQQQKQNEGSPSKKTLRGTQQYFMRSGMPPLIKMKEEKPGGNSLEHQNKQAKDEYSPNGMQHLNNDSQSTIEDKSILNDLDQPQQLKPLTQEQQAQIDKKFRETARIIMKNKISNFKDQRHQLFKAFLQKQSSPMVSKYNSSHNTQSK